MRCLCGTAARVGPALLRAAGVVALATWLQGSGCTAKFCSGDCDHDDHEESDDGRTPLVWSPDPFGGPFGRPLPAPGPGWPGR